MEPLLFQPSAPFTIGVEVELQLLASPDLNLAPLAPALLARVPANLPGEVKPEFIQSMVEVSTPVCQDLDQVAEELAAHLRVLERCAAELDCVFFAASLHPFGLVRERQLSPGSRYRELMDDLQLAGRRLVTQALHVHIGLPDEISVLRVHNGIREFLPTLLALTTSSPFFEGEDSGFYSYRTNLFKALPRTGIPGALAGWEEFQELVILLNEASLLHGIKELWWDVRPHPDFGTIEIRICDLPSHFDEILALAALIQALVVMLARDAPRKPVHREIILQNKWHASRYGLAGTRINPQRNLHTTFGAHAARMLEGLAPIAGELGGRDYLEPLRRVLQQGTSADRQRQLYRQTGDFREMIEILRGEFWQWIGKPWLQPVIPRSAKPVPKS